MISKQILSELKPLISDPGWGVVVNRLKDIRDKADIRFHNADEKTYSRYRGEYDMADRIYQMFKEPSKIAEDGISKIKYPQAGEQ